MTSLRTVAALYVDPRGPYPKMLGVECWNEARDARLWLVSLARTCTKP